MQNYFELFDLPQQFSIDLTQLDQVFRKVQSQVHPDKFVQSGDAEKRVAMQWATRANEAYQTLKKPLKRARYLCELEGVDLQTESNTSMPAAFLMQQMEWRENFDDAKKSSDTNAMALLEHEVTLALKSQIENLSTLFAQKDFLTAAQEIRACLFLEKFIEDIAAAED